MDNAFLSPILSAFGRSFLSKRNRGKSTGKKNIHRMGFLLLAAYGFWAVSLVALVLFLYFYFRFNRFDGICQGILMSCPVAGLLFYVWYRNAYVKITRTYVRRRNLFRLVEELEYRHISGYGYHDEPNGAIDTDGLYLNGPEDEEGFPTLGVQLHGVWANYDYVLGQLAFRILKERWANPESDEDQNLIQEYVSSGRAREICLEQSGFVFLENDNSPYKDSSEEDSSN